MESMDGKPFTSRSSEWEGDLEVWLREQAGDNRERLRRLRQNLCRARERDLTPRQREVMILYYDQGINIPQIARRLEVNPSTVSRTIRRGRERLYRCLRYSL